MHHAMFDIETLKEIRQKADEMSYLCMNRKLYHDPQSLKLALDNVSRALGMFAEMEIQRIKHENISYDPQKYIKGRVSLAHKTVKLTPQDDSNTA
ncbi:hypothetical protein JOC86_004627 [Bacillus pakistanensis]|uniref:Uncharacterized protein n=1 Tax=Rossellomorea pakistanensis TaxID=992288 RepID=A0ABS2NJM3_9BACI|nr:hypothetical protein [Bacillus pakistanensis]MBM7588052.1 hypothetical protein [Bacillus pakistanensis]